MKPPNPRSLRALGGDGRTFEVPQEHAQAVERILSDEPRLAAMAILQRTALLKAVEWLIDQQHLTTREYQLIGEAMATCAAESGTPIPSAERIVRTIADRSGGARVQLYRILGLNKYPTDDDPSLDILV